MQPLAVIPNTTAMLDLTRAEIHDLAAQIVETQDLPDVERGIRLAEAAAKLAEGEDAARRMGEMVVILSWNLGRALPDPTPGKSNPSPAGDRLSRNKTAKLRKLAKLTREQLDAYIDEAKAPGVEESGGEKVLKDPLVPSRRGALSFYDRLVAAERQKREAERARAAAWADREATQAERDAKALAEAETAAAAVRAKLEGRGASEEKAAETLPAVLEPDTGAPAEGLTPAAKALAKELHQLLGDFQANLETVLDGVIAELGYDHQLYTIIMRAFGPVAQPEPGVLYGTDAALYACADLVTS